MALPFAKPTPYDSRRHRLDRAAGVEPHIQGPRAFMGLSVVTGAEAIGFDGLTISQARPLVEELAETIDFDSWVLDGVLAMEKRDTDQEDGGWWWVYHAFDAISRFEWSARKTRPLSERRRDLELLLGRGFQRTRLVPQHVVCNPSSEGLQFWCERMTELGHEGVIWKALDAPYPFRKSSDWLSVRPTRYVQGVIAHVYERKNRPEEMIGIAVVLPDGQSIDVQGFTDYQRQQLALFRSYVGRVCDIRYERITVSGVYSRARFFSLRPDLNPADILPPSPVARKGRLSLYKGGK